VSDLSGRALEATHCRADTVTSGRINSQTREGTALAQLYNWQPSLQELTLVLENTTITPRVYSVIKLLFRYSQLSMTLVQ